MGGRLAGEGKDVMHLTLVGFEDQECRRLRKAVAFFSGILFEPKLKKEIYIQVQHDPTLQEQGECWPEDDNYRRFVISVRPHYDDWMRGHDDDPVAVVAHEMRHCWQWATGALRCPLKVYKDLQSGHDRSEYRMEWYGVPWSPGLHEMEAYDSPWEHDAYGKEVTLYKRWEMMERGRISLR